MRRFPQQIRGKKDIIECARNFTKCTGHSAERNFDRASCSSLKHHEQLGGNTNKSPLAIKLEKVYSSPKALKSFQNLVFIAELLKKKDRDTAADMEWKFVAMVNIKGILKGKKKNLFYFLGF
jgi:hypothetical protein